MNSILYDLKGQATLLNGLFALLVLAYIFSRFHKRKTAISLVSIAVLLFLLCATSWLPDYLAGRLERKYPPLSFPLANIDTGMILIHVLGSGYSLDKRLPATAQLGTTALARLVEGIRIHRSIKNSVIICSGNSSSGLETQAQVTKRAAIILGVEPDKLATLDTPGTTQEEAVALGGQYSKNSTLILVSDAIHLPRAMKLFEAEGFRPIAGPTNYKIKEGMEKHSMKWWPSYENIELMNYVIHESLGSLKASFSR